MLDKALLLLFSHGLATLLLVGCSPLQHKIREFQQIVADGDDSNWAAAFRVAFCGDTPEFIAQVSFLHS